MTRSPHTRLFCFSSDRLIFHKYIVIDHVSVLVIFLVASLCRFEVGCYSTHGNKFKIHVRSQFLSPIITYVVNLVFKFSCRKEAGKLDYLPLKYTLEGKTKVSVVYLAQKRDDESLIASLNRFTSNTGIIDLEIRFEDHKYSNSLEIEGIELKPVEKVSSLILLYSFISFAYSIKMKMKTLDKILLMNLTPISPY